MAMILETAAFLASLYGAGKLLAAHDLKQTNYLPLKRSNGLNFGARSRVWEDEYIPMQYISGGADAVYLGRGHNGYNFKADVIDTVSNGFDVQTQLLYEKKPDVGAPHVQQAWFLKVRANNAREFGNEEVAQDLERMANRWLVASPDGGPAARAPAPARGGCSSGCGR